MVSYRWAAPISGDWNVAADWAPALVPNDGSADVTIDNPTLAAYLVTIAAGETETVQSLTMNAVSDLAGSNEATYRASGLQLNGTLAFAAGSPGLLGGSLQTYIQMVNGTMINPGTIDGFIQTEGNVLLTGTNGFYVTNWLQSLGTTTVDVKSIAEMTGNTLFDGIYEAQGGDAFVNLGGPRQNLIVNIATIEGPPLIPDGWTELLLNGKVTDIGEWNGAGYVGIESTLTQIANRGTFDVLGGRDYHTAKTLTISTGGLLNLQAGTVTTALLNINGGTVQGSGTINSGVINNGTLRALDGLLTVGAGGLVGTGLVSFDFDQKAGTVAATGGTMEVHGVGPGQTFVMNGDDQLVIDTPISFAGTIDAKAGDTFFLGGVKATSASLQGQTLVLLNGATAVASLKLGGSYAGDTFATSPFGTTSTEVKVTAAVAAPAVTDSPGSIYTVPATISADTLNIAAATPEAFLSGGGSNAVTAGAGDETFSIDVRNLTSATLSTLANFHSGDDLRVYGLSLSDFSVSLSDSGGASGGLALAFTEAGHPTASLVLPGYSLADLTDGRLSQSFSMSADERVPYLTVHPT